MKRVISLVLVALIAVAVLAGCGSNGSGDAGKSVDLNAVMDKINSENGLSLEKVTEAKMLNRYYGVDEKDVKQFAAEMDKSDPNAPVEIVLIEANDAAAAENVKKALETKYRSVLSTYTSYTPEKVDMVKACKVTEDGNFLSLIIADNAATMVKTYQDSIQ